MEAVSGKSVKVKIVNLEDCHCDSYKEKKINKALKELEEEELSDLAIEDIKFTKNNVVIIYSHWEHN